MKSGKIIALGLLALLPIAMKAQEAQEIEKLNARIDSLSQETTTLDKIVRKLSKFKVSAYIQGQFQYGQEDATLKVGDKNEHEDKGFNRFGIRRGRLKFEYNDGIGTGAVQIEANDKGVSFRDLYIGIKDPWTTCAATAQFSIGSTMDQVGGAVGLDYNPETGDALFGYYDATFEYRHIYPYPIGDGFLFTYNFWRGDGKTWNTELLLTVKDCLTFAAVDWDGDGVTELLVRTRWPEKPYTVYDMVDGSVTETWPDTLDPEFTEHLLTESERQERLQEQLRREGVDLETERASSDDFVL